jgi:hypothetical protein
MPNGKIILFQNNNTNGQSLMLRDSDKNLNRADFDNKTSSLIVIEGTWQLFSDPDYGGAVCTVSADGGPEKDGVYPNYLTWSGVNDTISSVKLLPPTPPAPTSL